MTDITDNPYEQAEKPEEKLEEDINNSFDLFQRKGEMSRPAFAEEILTHAQTYHEYAKNTERRKE